MSYLETAAAYYSSRARTLAKSLWQIVKRKWQEVEGLKSAFYFFDLRQGCKLIALFEAVTSFVRICWIYYLVYQSDTKSLFPDPIWVYYWRNGRKNFLFYHYTHYHFHVGLHLVTILNSLLLLVGMKWSKVAFLFYWIYISQLTGTMTIINNIFSNFTFSQLYFTIPSIIISLIWKIREMPRTSAVEIEDPDLEFKE